MCLCKRLFVGLVEVFQLIKQPCGCSPIMALPSALGNNAVALGASAVTRDDRQDGVRKWEQLPKLAQELRLSPGGGTAQVHPRWLVLRSKASGKTIKSRLPDLTANLITTVSAAQCWLYDQPALEYGVYFLLSPSNANALVPTEAKLQ